MRIFEVVGSPFYLGASKPLKGVIEPQEAFGLLGADREHRLEERRPEGCIPRDKSFLLTTDRRWSTEHIYAVEPIGEVRCFHTGWLNRLAGCDVSQEGVASHYASGYWSGRECPEDRDAPWEHRAGEARVVARVGGEPIIRVG